MQRIVALALTVSSASLGVMFAYIIQNVTFGGYLWMLGLAFAGGSFVAGVYLTLIAR